MKKLGIFLLVFFFLSSSMLFGGCAAEEMTTKEYQEMNQQVADSLGKEIKLVKTNLISIKENQEKTENLIKTLISQMEEVKVRLSPSEKPKIIKESKPQVQTPEYEKLKKSYLELKESFDLLKVKISERLSEEARYKKLYKEFEDLSFQVEDLMKRFLPNNPTPIVFPEHQPGDRKIENKVDNDNIEEILNNYSRELEKIAKELDKLQPAPLPPMIPQKFENSPPPPPPITLPPVKINELNFKVEWIEPEKVPAYDWFFCDGRDVLISDQIMKKMMPKDIITAKFYVANHENGWLVNGKPQRQNLEQYIIVKDLRYPEYWRATNMKEVGFQIVFLKDNNFGQESVVWANLGNVHKKFLISSDNFDKDWRILIKIIR